MALTNVLLLSQIAGYVVGLILSICMALPMSMHQSEFNGHCLLFSQGNWNTNGQLDMMWASRAYCNYIIVVAVLLFTISSVQIYRLSVLMYKGLDTSFLSAFIEACVCMLLCALCISAALIVTLGFMQWCENITMRFPSCETAAGQNIDPNDGINTEWFYIEIGSVQFGAWAAFATCVGLSVFATLKVCRYHQLENIQVSMYRERQRLVNEQGSPAPSGRCTPPAHAHE